MRSLKHPTEHQIQSALVKWADLNSGRHPELRMLFAIPNGGWRDPVTAAKLKAEGVRAGIPDLFIAWPVPRPNLLWYHGLFIEVKRGTMGRVREQQAVWAGALKALHYEVAVVRSVEEGIAALRAYLKIP